MQENTQPHNALVMGLVDTAETKEPKDVAGIEAYVRSVSMIVRV
jgi:hypothetical protein